MEIKLHFSGNADKRKDTIHTILVTGMRSLRGLVELYRAATPEAIQSYFEENGNPDEGEIADEVFLEHASTILADVDIDTLLYIDRNIGHLGSKTPVEKYWTALEYLNVLVANIKEQIVAYTVYTDSTLATLRFNLKDAIGDFTYAFACNAFDPYTNIDIIETDETVACDQMLADALVELYPNDPNAVVTFAKELADLQEEFTVSAPIEDLAPSAWEAMNNSCTPDIRMQLADYGKYITSLDIRAFESGYLTIDDNFLDTLIARKNSVSFVGNVIPNAWASFVKLVPDSMIADFYEVELNLTQEDVKLSLENGKIADDLFERILSGGRNDGKTSIFGSFD